MWLLTLNIGFETNSMAAWILYQYFNPEQGVQQGGFVVYLYVLPTDPDRGGWYYIFDLRLLPRAAWILRIQYL